MRDQKEPRSSIASSSQPRWIALALLPALFVCLAALGPGVLAAQTRGAPVPGAAEILRELSRSDLIAPDGRPLFPRDLQVHTDGARARLVLEGSFHDADRPAAQQEVIDALRLEVLLGALSAAGARGGVEVVVLRPDGTFVPLGGAGPDGPPLIFLRPTGTPPPGAGPAARPSPFLLDLPLGGALLGRRIGVSAGHGWIDNGNGGYRTQRSRLAFTGCGACRGITEDFFSAELASRWVIPILQRMGAEVVVVREPDHDLGDPLIVDDGDPAHTETGIWQAGTSPDGFGGDYRSAAPGETATARFALGAAPGLRHVALRFREGSNRSTAAQITLEHAGGQRTFLLDQRRMGRLWLDLGAAWLDADSALVLSPGAGDGYLIADAVRTGGGIFVPASKPFWQMAAKSYVPWSGAPGAVTALGDVTIRPAQAEFAGVDLYLSLHGNASGAGAGSSANGMSTYRYSCQSYADYTASSVASACDDPPGSTRLMDEVHGAILAQVHADWDPNFGDRGRRVANFGELRVLAGAPGVLVETAFFDNLEGPSGNPPPRHADNQSMHDPRWREAMALGIANGIARFFDAAALPLPARPTHVVARNTANGALEIGWEPVVGATLYLVQRARLGDGRPGRAFDAGVSVAAPPLRLDLTVLEPGAAYGVRVVAANASGMGLPSEAVVARFRGAHDLDGAAADALVISGYDRRDAWVQLPENDLQHAIEHGEALIDLLAGDLFFDGATDEAVIAGGVAPKGYAVVDLVAGKNRGEHPAVQPLLRDALAQAHGTGTLLIVSGEALGLDLDAGDATDLAFLETTLGTRFVADNAGAFTFSPVASAVFGGLGSFSLDDGSGGVYAVGSPDVFAASGSAPGAEVVLTYSDGQGAAIARPGAFAFGVGLEAVVPLARRRALFDRMIATALPDLPRGDLDLDGASDLCERRFGLDPLDGSDGAKDPDGDGVSSAAECQAGTDPTVNEGSGPDGGTGDRGDAGRPMISIAVTGSCGCGTGPGSSYPSLPSGFLLAFACAAFVLRRRSPRARRGAYSNAAPDRSPAARGTPKRSLVPRASRTSAGRFSRRSSK